MVIKCFVGGLQISRFGVRVRYQNKLRLKIHCGGLQCLCKDTARKTSDEDKKHCATFLQNESVSPSPQEINQSAIKIYFQLLEFTSSLVDGAHINLRLKVVWAEQPLSEAAQSGGACSCPCSLCSCWMGLPHTEMGLPHTEITHVAEEKTHSTPPL